MKKNIAIVLAAGQGSRMHSDKPKQYLLLSGKPVLFYCLETFEKSEVIDEIILVTGAEEIEFCRTEIVEKYNIKKVSAIIAGGKERFHSVFCGLQEIKQGTEETFVFIHDGARPFVSEEMLKRAYEAVQKYEACVVGMPVKDTIKIADTDAFVRETPKRETVWQIQTPQVFSYPIVYAAYKKLLAMEQPYATDDAMVVENMLSKRIRLVKGSYRNIKITTPEDMDIADIFLKTGKQH